VTSKHELIMRMDEYGECSCGGWSLSRCGPSGECRESRLAAFREGHERHVRGVLASERRRRGEPALSKTARNERRRFLRALRKAVCPSY